MNILVVGSGGREHALAWKLVQSESCDLVYVAPGNAGTQEEANVENIAIPADDVESLVSFSKEKNIGLVVIGPEAPLVLGLADRLIEENIPVFGPTQKGAQLEGSKIFMKNLCKKYNIKTAASENFTDIEKAHAFIEQQTPPVVVKADGLAAGKGVIIAQTIQEAKDAASMMLSDKEFGDAGASIVVEEFLEGEEVSYFAITDGKTILPLTSAQDHKRAFDNDQGPNTGGMGAYSPARAGIMLDGLEETIIKDILEPTVRGMAAEGCPFQGVLYAGLMIVNGTPYLLEYNVRFGDPECQPIMMRLKNDLCDLLLRTAEGRLDTITAAQWDDKAALCIVMASNGYPGSYTKGTVIEGINKAESRPETLVFHAGTSKNSDEKMVNTGGRVLGITALGNTIPDAQNNAYEAASKITWPDGFYRNDIGWRASSEK